MGTQPVGSEGKAVNMAKYRSLGCSGWTKTDWTRQDEVQKKSCSALLAELQKPLKRLHRAIWTCFLIDSFYSPAKIWRLELNSLLFPHFLSPKFQQNSVVLTWSLFMLNSNLIQKLFSSQLALVLILILAKLAQPSWYTSLGIFEYRSSKLFCSFCNSKMWFFFFLKPSKT